MLALLSRYWWVLVIRGVMAIALGAFAFARPQETIAALVLVFGAIALVDGIIAVVASIAGWAAVAVVVPRSQPCARSSRRASAMRRCCRCGTSSRAMTSPRR